MNAGRKLAKDDGERFFRKDNRIRRDDNGSELRSIRGSVMVPGTGGALLIATAGKAIIVMMDGGKNRAHAHIEQANDPRYPTHGHETGST